MFLALNFYSNFLLFLFLKFIFSLMICFCHSQQEGGVGMTALGGGRTVQGDDGEPLSTPLGCSAVLLRTCWNDSPLFCNWLLSCFGASQHLLSTLPGILGYQLSASCLTPQDVVSNPGCSALGYHIHVPSRRKGGGLKSVKETQPSPWIPHTLLLVSHWPELCIPSSEGVLGSENNIEASNSVKEFTFFFCLEIMSNSGKSCKHDTKTSFPWTAKSKSLTNAPEPLKNLMYVSYKKKCVGGVDILLDIV